MADNKKSVLIIDNSLLVIERITMILKELNILKSISFAENYDTAIEILSKKKPDIVLLEIQLRGKNGLQLLEAIVKNYPGVKVVMLTNTATEIYRSICKKLGASYFVDKSKEFEMIPGIITSLSR